MPKAPPVRMVIDRLVAHGITFKTMPAKTEYYRHGQIADVLLVSDRNDFNLRAEVPDHPAAPYIFYYECSLAEPVRELAKSPIHVHRSTWIRGMRNNPELRLSTRKLSDQSNRYLFTIELPTAEECGGTARKMPTKPQLAILMRAVSGEGRHTLRPDGVVENPAPTRGLAYSNWDKMMKRLCVEGLFRPYVHGGFEITEAGRQAAAMADGGR